MPDALRTSSIEYSLDLVSGPLPVQDPSPKKSPLHQYKFDFLAESILKDSPKYLESPLALKHENEMRRNGRSRTLGPSEEELFEPKNEEDSFLFESESTRVL